MKLQLRVLALAAFVGLFGVPSTAHACINGIELEIERINATPAGQVAIAERELAGGHPVWAAARTSRSRAHGRPRATTAECSPRSGAAR